MPFRGRLPRAATPQEWGQRQYHVRLVNDKGEAHDNPSKIRELANVGSDKAVWQIIESHAVRDDNGQLAWSEKQLRELPVAEYHMSYVQGVAEKLRDNHLGHVLQEEQKNGLLTLSHVERYNNDTLMSKNYYQSPAKENLLKQLRFGPEASEAEIRQGYGQLRQEIDKANLDLSKREQEIFLQGLAADKADQRHSEILKKAEADYQQMSEAVDQRREAWADYQAKREEAAAKTTDKDRAKRAQSTINSLRSS